MKLTITTLVIVEGSYIQYHCQILWMGIQSQGNRNPSLT